MELSDEEEQAESEFEEGPFFPVFLFEFFRYPSREGILQNYLILGNESLMGTCLLIVERIPEEPVPPSVQQWPKTGRTAWTTLL